MAKIKVTPEDFLVQEIPAYEPSGEGDHLFVRFTKRNMTTDAAVAAIARALGVKPRDVGVAGMKDRVAVTEQTISVPFAPGRDAAAAAFHHATEAERITVHEAKRHTNKLKTGHLRAIASPSSSARSTTPIARSARSRASPRTVSPTPSAPSASAARGTTPIARGRGWRGERPHRAIHG